MLHPKHGKDASLSSIAVLEKDWCKCLWRSSIWRKQKKTDHNIEKHSVPFPNHKVYQSSSQCHRNFMIPNRTSPPNPNIRPYLLAVCIWIHLWIINHFSLFTFFLLVSLFSLEGWCWYSELEPKASITVSPSKQSNLWLVFHLFLTNAFVHRYNCWVLRINWNKMFQQATKPSIFVTHRGTGGEGLIFSSIFFLCVCPPGDHRKPQNPDPSETSATKSGSTERGNISKGITVLGTAPALQVRWRSTVRPWKWKMTFFLLENWGFLWEAGFFPPHFEQMATALETARTKWKQLSLLVCSKWWKCSVPRYTEGRFCDGRENPQRRGTVNRTTETLQ